MTPAIDQVYRAIPAASTQGRGSAVITNSAAQGNAAADSSGSITANDFLTLLVTEMKNQDPTANTDPNQYINQLVQVNSLQQLIAINETLKSSLPTTAKGDAESARSGAGVSRLSIPTDKLTESNAAQKNAVAGNVSTFKGGSAASRVATALTQH